MRKKVGSGVQPIKIDIKTSLRIIISKELSRGDEFIAKYGEFDNKFVFDGNDWTVAKLWVHLKTEDEKTNLIRKIIEGKKPDHCDLIFDSVVQQLQMDQRPKTEEEIEKLKKEILVEIELYYVE